MQPLFTMMIGLPGSGKSTYVEVLSKKTSTYICSTDKIREELTGDENDQSKNEEVFVKAQKIIREKLSKGEDVIFDATNVRRKHRIALLGTLKKVPCKNQAVVVATPYADCLKLNAVRDRRVPEEKIRNAYLAFVPPHYAEGFDDIVFYFNEDCFNEKSFSLNDLFYGEKGLLQFDQENSHHALSLGNHCLAAEKYIRQYAPEDKNLQTAALLHDIGKVPTKSKYNAKGKENGDYHYYSHHNAGAYDSLFYLKDMGKSVEGIVDISNLIYFHMHPYLSWKESEKALRKDTSLMGENFIKRVELLHRADVAAH